MAQDALDPGDDGSYPYFPRRPDGTPYWSDRAETDGIPLAGPPQWVPHAPMPRGIRRTLRDGEWLLVDVTPYAGSSPVTPPALPE